MSQIEFVLEFKTKDDADNAAYWSTDDIKVNGMTFSSSETKTVQPVALHIPVYPARKEETKEMKASLATVISAEYVFEPKRLDAQSVSLYDGQVPGLALQRVLFDSDTKHIHMFACDKPREASELFQPSAASKLAAQFISYTKKGFVDVRPAHWLRGGESQSYIDMASNAKRFFQAFTVSSGRPIAVPA